MVSSGADLLALFSCSPNSAPGSRRGSSAPGSRRGSRRPSRKFTQFQMPGNFDQKVRFEPTHTTHLVYLLHDHTPSLLMCPSPYPFLSLPLSSPYTFLLLFFSLIHHSIIYHLPLSTSHPSNLLTHSTPLPQYSLSFTHHTSFPPLS